MDKYIFDESNGLWYERQGDYYLELHCLIYISIAENRNLLPFIMGHASITMTLGYYAHADAGSAKAEMDRLAA